MEKILLQRIREANDELRKQLQWIAQALDGKAQFDVSNVREMAATVAEVGSVLSEAQRLAPTAPEMSSELAIYRENLAAIQTALDRMRLVLLTRRTIIGSQRGHLAAASRWAAACRQTQ